jgi:hypothetical protein
MPRLLADAETISAVMRPRRPGRCSISKLWIATRPTIVPASSASRTLSSGLAQMVATRLANEVSFVGYPSSAMSGVTRDTSEGVRRRIVTCNLTVELSGARADVRAWHFILHASAPSLPPLSVLAYFPSNRSRCHDD